jgi:hypothetical protein
MTLRILCIGPEEKARAKEIASYSSQPENIYHPGDKAKVPGDHPEHVAQFGDFRCVFSWTRVKSGVYRHLSVSVGDPSRLPNPVIVEEIARLFGFAGSFGNWQMDIDAPHGVVIVAERVDDVAGVSQGHG